MTWGRAITTSVAAVTVGAGAVVVTVLGSSAGTATSRTTSAQTTTSIRATTAARRATAAAAPAAPETSTLVQTSAGTARAARTAPTGSSTSATSADAATAYAAGRRNGQRLPLRFRTYRATRVITVTASSSWSTTATLRAWNKAPGGGWLPYGRAVTAHVGADGIGTASESSSHTPRGSFTLTHAFGRKPNPGTRLHYFRTTPADWWISQSGPLYNTHQRCSRGCDFRQGSPNEHLYYETPYYNHAVVIDYNTRNSATGVRQGAGSAFFLHVTDGNPTAGCVAINPRRLNTLMRWLRPAAHPRILIGVRT